MTKISSAALMATPIGKWNSPAPNLHFPIAPGIAARREQTRNLVGLFRQILVEPVRKFRDICGDVGPSVRCTLLDNQLTGNVGFPQFVDHEPRLLQRDQPVGVTVDDQGGWIVGRDVING